MFAVRAPRSPAHDYYEGIPRFGAAAVDASYADVRASFSSFHHSTWEGFSTAKHCPTLPRHCQVSLMRCEGEAGLVIDPQTLPALPETAAPRPAAVFGTTSAATAPLPRAATKKNTAVRSAAHSHRSSFPGGSDVGIWGTAMTE